MGILKHVPDTGRKLRIASSMFMRIGRPGKTFLFRYLPLALGLAISAGTALFLGLNDVIFQVSLGSALIGAVFTVAGFLGIVGLKALFNLSGLLNKRRSSWHHELRWYKPTRQIMLAFGGALAGLYTDSAIALYSLNYDRPKSIFFGVAAISCAICAYLLLTAVREIWNEVSGGLKSLAALFAAFGLAAQFWYARVYVPTNTEVGLSLSVKLGAVTKSGGDTLIEIDFTAEDSSPESALVLGSMLTVYGVNYVDTNGSKDLPDKQTLQNLINYTNAPSTSGYDIRFGGHVNEELVADITPLTSYDPLFPSSPISTSYLVLIPGQTTKGILIKTTVEYASNSRLTLGDPYKKKKQFQLTGCRNGKTFSDARRIRESKLRSFTAGNFVLYSTSCASLPGPFITENILAPGATEPSPAQERIFSEDDIRESVRYDSLGLSTAGKGT